MNGTETNGANLVSGNRGNVPLLTRPRPARTSRAGPVLRSSLPQLISLLSVFNDATRGPTLTTGAKTEGVGHRTHKSHVIPDLSIIIFFSEGQHRWEK